MSSYQIKKGQCLISVADNTDGDLAKLLTDNDFLDLNLIQDGAIVDVGNVINCTCINEDNFYDCWEFESEVQSDEGKCVNVSNDGKMYAVRIVGRRYTYLFPGIGNFQIPCLPGSTIAVFHRKYV